MFIVELTYTADLKEVDKHLDAHIAYLKREYTKGTFVASGRKVPRDGGVILAKTDSLEELNWIIEDDPFYIAGVADFTITEFIPTMTAEGLESLIETPPE